MSAVVYSMDRARSRRNLDSARMVVWLAILAVGVGTLRLVVDAVAWVLS